MTEPKVYEVQIPNRAMMQAIYDALTEVFVCDEMMKMEAMHIAEHLIHIAKANGVQIHEVRVYEPDYVRTFDPYVMVESRTQRDIWRERYVLNRQWAGHVRRVPPVERG